MIKEDIKCIVFDADDTLWVNEPFFREAEASFCELLKMFADSELIMKTLYDSELRNLPLYGYGIKGFMLCMIETAMIVSKGEVDAKIIERIMELGKEQLNHPLVLLEGVEATLAVLSKQYRLALATKGDLLDQQRKIKLSGLSQYFSHIEIMSEKKQNDYVHLFKALGVAPEEILMIGNSLKSDVLPILKLGGYAIHIPFHTTWIHEVVQEKVVNERFSELKCISDLQSILL